MIVNRLLLVLSLYSSVCLCASEIAKPNAHEWILGRVTFEDKGYCILKNTDPSVTSKSAMTDQLLTLVVQCDAFHKKPDGTFPQISLNSFDARMPQHNHGMNVKPQITLKKDREWQVNGIKFHMPGAWDIILKIQFEKEELSGKMQINL